jgi:hypothetical protein
MTEHEAQGGLSQGLDQGLNRRHLFQSLAAGAAVSGVIGSPALAQATTRDSANRCLGRGLYT